MDKQDVIRFFDKMASTWDADMICSAPVVDQILDGARLRRGMEVLDVACGTGVMFPFYLGRGVKRVTAIDISPNMAEIAAGKIAGKPVDVICGDAENYNFGRKFDCVMVYNAFPHFPDPAHMIEALAGWVRPGGTLTVAHGMSAEALRHHHSGAAFSISIDLPDIGEMSELFSPWFDVKTAISNEYMYQVTGVRR